MYKSTRNNYNQHVKHHNVKHSNNLNNNNNTNNNTNNITWEDYYSSLEKKHKDSKVNKFMVNYVLNASNTFITKEFINKVFQDYNVNHTCHDLTLYQIATTHSSYTNDKNFEDLKTFKSVFMGVNVLGGDQFEPISNALISMSIPLQESSYQRLEFLGDSILRLILSEYLFIRYPELQEGGLTKLRSQIENASTVALITRKLNLNKYVIIAKNYEMIKARDRNEKIQCDIFESFLAALYLDICKIKYHDIGKCINLLNSKNGHAYQICYDFVISLIEKNVDIPYLLANNTNYKDQLLQYFHTQDWGDPKYSEMERIVDEKNMGKKTFKMCVRDPDNNIIGIGTSTSKQGGEKLAAKYALIKFNVINSTDEEYIIDATSDVINK